MLQDASLAIWDSKYRLRDAAGEPVDADMPATLARVARALAEVEPTQREAWYERFLWAMRQGAIPAGRILSNAGALTHKSAASLINCTVAATIPDSMEGILEANKQAGLTLKAGCGIGYDFSTLRPRGACVQGAGASTSGPLSFMDIFDHTCRTVTSAGGRRGAQMGVMEVSHPDIEDFIRAKREPGRLRHFNLSVLISRDFLQAVEAGADWPLVFPAHPAEWQDPQCEIVYRPWPISEGYRLDDEGRVAMRVYRRVPARELWQLIMRSTYDFAEPGFLLIDEVNEMNNLWWCEWIRATNPCVTAETWVHTAAGPRQVNDLVGKPFIARVNGVDAWSGPQGFFQTASKPVLRLEMEEGYSLRLTPDHRVKRVVGAGRDGGATEWCEAGHLQPGDRVMLHDHRTSPCWPGLYNHAQGYLMGLLVGDGTLKQDAAVLSVWRPVRAVDGGASERAAGPAAVMAEALAAAKTLAHRRDFKGWAPIKGRDEYRLSSAAIHALAVELGMAPAKKGITALMEQASSDFYCGFLRGLFDADGSVQGGQAKGVSVRLAQSDLLVLKAVQRMLLRLGIASRLYTERRGAGSRVLPDGRGGMRAYPSRAQHELVISVSNLVQFAERIGFADSDKHARLQAALAGYKRALNRERFCARVKQLVSDGLAPVFDVQVPGIHFFDANGLQAHNCGEQPLPPEGACLLGSIDLTRFVREPFTPQASFDSQAFAEVVRVFTRALDNVVELSALPLPGQRREIAHKRRHGMGYFGLGSAMAMLRMPYGSPESLAFTEQVTREMALVGWQEGVALAREKGAAPVFEQRFVVTPRMLALRPEMAADGVKPGDELPGRVLFARYSRYMQRLAQLAPALVAEIEQLGCRFTHHSSIAPTGTIALSFGNNASNGIEPSFSHRYIRNVIVPGRLTKEAVTVFSAELLAYRQQVDANADEHGLPDWFSTAEVSPLAHLEVQAAAQRWVDSSISKTINVPADIPFEDFQHLYRHAARLGLKGCTTYRPSDEVPGAVLVTPQTLADTRYVFTLEDGSQLELPGDALVEYQGQLHTAANLHEALREGYFGKL